MVGAGAGAGGALAPPKTFRGITAKSVLAIDWGYPIYTPPEKKRTGDTFAKEIRRALSREDALDYIAGDDPRPLLVLRECKVCNGTDDALLKGGMENEKTFLFSTWFHCVKLPADVMEADHPFHNLFVQEKPEHLFVCSVDGSNHDPLESETSRTELWESLADLLVLEYEESPEPALKELARLLDKLDTVDSRWNELQAKRDAILERDGPKSKKLPKLALDLEELEAERQDLLEQVAEARVLELKEREASKERPAPAGEKQSGDA